MASTTTDIDLRIPQATEPTSVPAAASAEAIATKVAYGVTIGPLVIAAGIGALFYFGTRKPHRRAFGGLGGYGRKHRRSKRRR